MTSKHFLLAGSLALAVSLGAPAAFAQTVENIPNGGSLFDSTATTTYDNVLAAPTSSFTYGGPIGQFSAISNGTTYYYTDYLVTVAGSSAEDVTSSLTNSTGTGTLNARLYSYNGSSFLLGASAGSAGVDSWSSNINLGSANVSLIPATALTAGEYVLEIRGTTNAGTFAGSLSLSPVPEPSQAGLLVAGLLATFAVGVMRRRQA